MNGGQKLLKSINGSSGGPVNTLNSQTRPAKRQMSGGPSRPETVFSSPYFPAPNHAQDLDRSSPHEDVVELRSTSSGKTMAGPSQNVNEFRSAHPKPGGRTGRVRKSRMGSTSLAHPPRRQDVRPRQFPRRTAVESPDALAGDEHPPATVMSDILSPAKRRSQRLDLAIPPIKSNRPRTPVETIYDSDELNHEPNSNGKRPNNFSSVRQPQRHTRFRGDIQSTSFGIPRRPAEQPLMVVKSAACGKESYESDDQEHRQIILQPDPSGRSELAPMTTNGERMALKWLHIDIHNFHGLYLAEGRSPFVVIHRARTGSNDAKLCLEFTATEHASVLASMLSGPRGTTKEPNELEIMVRKALSDANRYTNTPSKLPTPTHHVQGAESSETPWTKARNTQAASLEHGPRRGRLVDGMRTLARSSDNKSVAPAESFTKPSDVQSSALVSEGHVPSADSPMQKRRTRRSSPALVVRQPSPDRWTSKNPDWKIKWHRSLVYPATGKNRTTVDDDDIARLDEGEFLNDNLISFYLRYLQLKLESEQPSLLKKVYIFNTFFFEKLRSTKGKINYEGVKAWTTKFDLFSYDHVIVPVNEHAHWYLAIICNVPNALGGVPFEADVEVLDVSQDSARPNEPGPCLQSPTSPTQPMSANTGSRRASSGSSQKADHRQPKIVTLDSLGSQHPPTYKALKDYLVEEAKDKKGVDLAVIPTGMKAKEIPQQDNFCDCGIFVLGYVEEFLKDPDGAARKLLQKESPGWDMQAPSQLRDSIRTLLFHLQDDQQSRLVKEKNEKRNSAAKKAAKLRGSRSPQLAATASQAALQVSPSRDAGMSTAREQSASSTAALRGPERGKPCADITFVGSLGSDSGASTSTPNEAFFSAQSSPDEKSCKEGASLESIKAPDDSKSEPTFVSKLPTSPEPERSDAASRLERSVGLQCRYDGIDLSMG